MTDRERYKTAHHESGHAIASLLYRLPLAAIEVGEAADSSGRCVYSRGLGDVDVGHVAIMCLSGPIAEARFDAGETMMPKDTPDYKMVTALLHMYDVPAWWTKRRIAYHEWLAALVVESHWPAIHEVARHLARDRVLDVDAVRTILKAGTL